MSEALTLLARALADGAEHDAEVARWLLNGLRDWHCAAGAVPLHRCLRLPASAKAAARRARDDLLRDAAALHAGGPWAKAEALAARIREFERRRWPCWRRLADPPAHALAVDTALFYARRQYGAPLPETARQIYRLLEH